MNVRAFRKQLGHGELRSFFAKESRMQAGRDACNLLLTRCVGARLFGAIVEVQNGAWLWREFEACQLRRLRADTFCKCEHLKRAAEHFRVD